MIKFAVIGAGHIGKRHAEMIKRHEEAELVAICDVKPISEVDAEKFGVPYFNSTEDLFNAGIDFNVVNVCTPNGLHAEHSLLALNHKKHIVCEKPMALQKQDCEAIIYKALQMHRNVFCVMQNRYSPPSAWMKEIIENKIIGDVYMVQLNCYWNRDERYYKQGGWKGTEDLDGGTLYTQFSHFIDIMYWLFGDIKDIQAKFNDFNHHDLTTFEDSGFVNFNFINGGMGAINYSTAVWDTNLESSLTVIGSKGSVKIGGQYMDKVEYCHIKDYVMPELAATNPANDYGAYKGSANNHGYIIDNVIDTLKGRSTITTNALEGLKIVDIIERIYSLRNADHKS